jgi:hypothetical protein
MDLPVCISTLGGKRMSDMLKNAIAAGLKEEIKNTYPHLQYPTALLAEISRVDKEDEKYYCTLRILDKTKSRDTNFPEIPYVLSNIPFKKGDIAVVILLYGECIPYIIGRYAE